MSQLSRVKASEDAEMRPTSARSHTRSLQAMEETMREEIRELQEQRAAAMMAEIVELQKERDVALGKVKRLEKRVKDMEEKMRSGDGVRRVNGASGAEGRGDLVNLLRQSLREEQLLTSDLKRKLQSAKKQNSVLSQHLQEVNGQPSSPDTAARRRSHSFDGQQSVPSPLASPAVTPRGVRKSSPFLKPPTPTVPQVAGGNLTTPPAGFSPTVIPRRYKLAAAISREAGTQTDLPPYTSNPPTPHTLTPHPSQPADRPTRSCPETTGKQTGQSDERCAELTPSILDTLSSARADILRLQQERDEAQRELAREREERASLKRESELLQSECGVLQDALSEFSRWVRSKLTTVEEDMDIFRVIYSLHGSLSQEQSALQEIQDKLHRTEQRVLQLEISNRHLTLAASEAEEKYQLSQTQARDLEERLMVHSSSSSSLLSPVAGSSHLQLRGRQFSSPQLPRYRHIPPPPSTHSPLHTLTPPPPHTHTTQDVV